MRELKRILLALGLTTWLGSFMWIFGEGIDAPYWVQAHFIVCAAIFFFVGFYKMIKNAS